MKKSAVVALLAALLVSGDPLRPRPVLAAAAAQQTDQVRALLQRLEQILRTGDASAYRDLLAATGDPARADTFAAQEFQSGVTRAVILERDREDLLGTLPGNGHRIVVDAFAEHRDRARIATWQLDLKGSEESGWRLADQTRLSVIDNLYRLSVNPAKQFDAHDFRVRAEDLELTLAEGSVFTIETDQGITGLILLGRGDMQFRPTPETERGQVRIFAGADAVVSRFDAAYLRVGAVDLHADLKELVARPVDPRELRRAEQVFREESLKSFGVDLSDLSPDAWSLSPGAGDFLAEVRTRRFETLTYSRFGAESEDISLFDRRRRKSIAVYASAAKLASRGRFYNEDDTAAYDILDYDIDLSIDPERQWLEGRATLRIETRSTFIGQITLRLAEPFAVQSISSPEYGRLFSLRMKRQNTVLVNLPVPVKSQTQVTLRVAYSGRLVPQPPDRETLQTPQPRRQFESPIPDDMFPRAEASYLYSSRSYWYPQAPITDYATATIRISVPATFTCVATGELASGSPTLVAGKQASDGRRLYKYTATRPVRYLAFLVSRFTRVAQLTIEFDGPPGGDDLAESSATPARTAPVGSATKGSLDLTVEANPRQLERGHELAARAVDIIRFYQSIVGDSPYESFTLALIENTLPGGHSPGYFAALNQPLPNTPLVWRSDPANFEGFPEFFLAHELAHQWWGQAVGWSNYHEQWLSEGFAQYFAGMYAQHLRGDEVFASILRQFRKWSLDESDQGPVYLGYRLGHIRNEGRVFRALVYNKGAAVLHMLRRLIGDDAFFRGIRRFYAESRFSKTRTDELRVAMEREAGRSFDRFFERWIYGSTLPHLTFSYRVESSAKGQEVVLRFDQSDEIFDLPVTVTLQYADRKSVDVVVAVTDRSVEQRVPLEGTLRSVTINRDDGTVAEIARN